jgi:hypothetical protein
MRYFRRHAKIVNFAPISLQDIAHPAAPNLTSRSCSRRRLLALPMLQKSPPLPTAEDILNATAGPPPITWETQRQDEYFTKTIDFLAFQKLPKDKQKARRIMLIAEHFEIVNGQLIHMAQFQRKRRSQYRPIISQICVPKEWRLAIMATFHDFLNHPNAEKCYYTLRERYFWKHLFSDINSYVLSCEICQKVACWRRSYIQCGKMPSHEVCGGVKY